MAAGRLNETLALSRRQSGQGGGRPVATDRPVLYHRIPAERYAQAFALQQVDRPPQLPGYHLYYDETGMALMGAQVAKSFRLHLGRVKARVGQSLLLARACAAGRRPSLADLMAGWGTDGLCLALRGCAVTLVERSPLVWAMLDEFVLRHRLPAKVVLGDAGAWCAAHPKAVDLAYLDPMHSPRRKAALPEQAMQHLRVLAWQDGLELAQRIEQAKAAARQRVVVKRRVGAPAVAKPSWQLHGRRVRFDVYAS